MNNIKKILTIIFLLFIVPILHVNISAKEIDVGWLVKLKTESIPKEFSEVLVLVNLEHNLYTTNNYGKIIEFAEYVEYFESNDNVQLIEGAEDIEIYSKSNSTATDEQWHINNVCAEYAWDKNIYGNEVNVAVIDTGCNSHKDIVDNLVDGYNFILKNEDYSDNHGHGTHISGIIAAEHNSEVMGIAPKVNLYALKCVDPSYSTRIDMIVDAIYSAVDRYRCKIINLSLGMPHKESLYEAIKYATDKNVVVLAAVGNDGDSNLYYPAAYDEVIGVGSVGENNEKSYFSQQNNSTFVVAPGENIKSLYGLSEYKKSSGTSQATAIATGAVALVCSCNKDITHNDIIIALKKYSKELGEIGYDESYGYGLINVRNLLLKLSDLMTFGWDIDENKVVDNRDAIYLLKHIMLPCKYYSNAYVDLDRNGVVDSSDSIFMYNEILYALFENKYEDK